MEYDYTAASGGVAAYLRLDDVIYPHARQIDYNYTGAVDSVMSRLSSITEQNGTTDAAYTYLGLDTIVAEDYPGGGVELNYDSTGNNAYSGFDRFGRVLDQLWAADSGANAFNPLEEYKYGYDADGDVLSQENKNAESLSNAYLYDAANRLINWAQGVTQMKTYSYDSVGNNIDSSLTGGKYNSDNEETTINNGGLQPNYDLAGNMQTLSNGDTAVYDAWGRLVEVDGTSGTVEQCEYDGTGRRVQVATPTAVETDYYSGQQVIESDTAVTGSGTTRYQWIWSPRYIDAPICRDTLDSNGNVESPTTGRIYYLGDANYNVTAVVQYASGSWAVAERYTYDPYGNVTIYTPDWGGTLTSSSVSNTIFFAGESFDTATGLYFDNARYYDPQLGRFISQDPMGARRQRQ